MSFDRNIMSPVFCHESKNNIICGHYLQQKTSQWVFCCYKLQFLLLLIWWQCRHCQRPLQSFNEDSWMGENFFPISTQISKVWLKFLSWPTSFSAIGLVMLRNQTISYRNKEFMLISEQLSENRSSSRNQRVSPISANLTYQKLVCCVSGCKSVTSPLTLVSD